MPTIATDEPSHHHPHHVGSSGGGGVHPSERCSGCNATGLSLLSCDDPEFQNHSTIPGTKPRFCANCMIGKKVRVFWPVDNSWYTGVVLQYDDATGEHLLKYDDEDTEWVKIGESNTCAPPPASGASSQGHNDDDPNIDIPNPPPSDKLETPRKGDRSPQQTHPTQSSYAPEHVVERTTPDRHHWPIEHSHSHPDPSHPSYGMYPGSGGVYGMHGHSGYPGSASSYHPHHPHVTPGSHYGGPPPYGYPGVMNLPPSLVGSGAVADDHHPSHHSSTSMRHPHPAKAPSEPSSSPVSMSGSASKRKAGPKAWTKEEDAKLLNIVQSMRMPMKWSIVAQSLPDRTGKQCRERYVNHLNPRLKVTDWSPVEDATIFYFYNISGSHWAKMSRGIPGRTDNGIKNRFHNLRRQLEREDEHRLRLSTAENFPEEIRLDRIREFPAKLQGKAAELWDMKNGIGVLAAQSILGGAISRNSSRFGPFRKAKDGDMCVRCGLLMPSLHTGTELCTKSGWCQSCTRIPPHICSNLLRECLNLRREQDPKLRRIIETWEEHFGAGEEKSDEDVPGSSSRVKKEGAKA